MTQEDLQVPTDAEAHPCADIPSQSLAYQPTQPLHAGGSATEIEVEEACDHLNVLNVPRLTIKKMVLENFKSYAGRIEIGPFHKSFTSIVGPNGSGKSNVIDALLFVFGFKAKKMRQEKLSGLIHSSNAYPNLEYCNVEIHFHEIKDLPGPDDYEVVPDTDLVVSRVATNANKSQYYINGKTSNYTEVTTLLKERGIDLDHKRFLILQGEVESISQMKPKAANEHEDGLLEYLEDIIGTSKYKQPIEEKSAELEKLNDDRTEKLNRVKLVEGDLKALESQKEEAEDYLKEEENLTLLKSQLYQYYVHESDANVVTAQTELDDLKAKLNQESDLLGEESEQLKILQRQHDTILRDHDVIMEQAVKTQKEYAKFEKEYIQLEEKRKHLKHKKKKIEKSIEKDQHLRSENAVWVANHELDLKKQMAELERLDENLVKAQAEMDLIRDGLKGKTDGFQKKIDEKKQELMPWTDKINAKQSEIDIKLSDIQLLEEKANGGERTIKETEEQINVQQRILKERSQDVQKYTKSISVLQKNIEQLEEKRQKEVDLREEIVQCRQQAEQAKSVVKASISQDGLIKLLMAESKAGRIPGVFGRLCDLGAIDSKYDVAISSAFFERLKWIVVDTVKTAERCLRVLKMNNAGRASFIVLERTSSVKQDVPTPENAPRLIDLIKVKHARYLSAFYYVVRDTLVAENLEQANRLAFGKNRWKVVTLDGKVIDKAGTMSGGGNRVAQGGMSSALCADEDSVDIASLEKMLMEKEGEQEKLRTLIQNSAIQLEKAKQDLPEAEENLQQASLDVTTAEKLLENHKNRILELKKAAKPEKNYLTKIESIKKDVLKAEKDRDSLIEKTQGLHDAINELQNKILEVGGNELRRQNTRVKDIEDQISTINESCGSIESQMKCAKKNLDKANKSLEQAGKELQQITKELDEIQTIAQEKTNEALCVQESSELAQKQSEQKKTELQAIKKTLEAKSEIVNQLKQQRVDFENAVQDWTKVLNDNKKKSQHWKHTLSNLSLKYETSTAGEKTLRQYTEDELKSFDKEDLKREMVVLEEKLEIAKPNLDVLEEYQTRERDFNNKKADLDEMTRLRDEVKTVYDELRKRRLDEFMKGFTIISQKLKEMYQMITLGGNAELELVDSLDPFSEGIAFSVMPPKKSWKNISNLSGGEKTLSSLALVFALHHFKPTPLYVMDEIDAALDFRNVSIIANYIKERTKNAQFVIISLRNNMFELADRLVGIYKTDNCTKSVSINPGSIGVAAR